MTVIKKYKNADAIRQRKLLIARRWCFFALMVIAIFMYVFWSNAHCGSFGRILSWIIFGLWLVPLVQVLYCKFFPPIVTPLMVHRYFQQRKAGKSDVRIRWQYVPIEEISPYLINAVDVAENMGLFMYSRGFLFYALRWAHTLNQMSPRLRGGSIITQQTAKNCFLPHSRTLLRKLVEVYYVVLMELFWNKKRIMECYLNIVEFGEGLYGCEVASQHYFQHSAAAITERESILLAATLPWPLSANPDKHTSYYDERISRISARLLEHEPIDWNARYEDLDSEKIKEGNRGLLFFVKWLCLQQIKSIQSRKRMFFLS